jgi:hypothetical protein
MIKEDKRVLKEYRGKRYLNNNVNNKTQTKRKKKTEKDMLHGKQD